MIKKHINKKRIFQKIYGTPEKPRLSVFRSNKHIYGQIIDDINHKTLASFSSLQLKQSKLESKKLIFNSILAKEVGEKLAEKIIKKNIQKIVFDKNGYPYHGRIRAFAESLREKGINF